MIQSFVRTAAIGGIVAALSACTMIHKTTGNVLVDYGSKHMVPYLMESDDLDMSCAMGESLTPLLMSFESVGSHPDKLGTLVYTSAASCSEALSTEAELRNVRALKDKNTAEAKDARTMQKRYAEVASRRQLEAYQRTTDVFGEVSDDKSCPKLKNDFDELVWLVGQVSGMQALLNDSTADNSVGVSRDIPAKVQRGATCVDDDKWWGIPKGTRAVVWTLLPMFAPDDVDTWAELEKAVDKGFEGGVRLASALYVMTAYNTDDDERVRKGIREFAQNGDDLNEDYILLDAMAENIIRNISDRLWTEETGRRTPYGSLGTFWDDKDDDESDLDIDDLL